MTGAAPLFFGMATIVDTVVGRAAVAPLVDAVDVAGGGVDVGAGNTGTAEVVAGVDAFAGAGAVVAMVGDVAGDCDGACVGTARTYCAANNANAVVMQAIANRLNRVQAAQRISSSPSFPLCAIPWPRRAANRWRRCVARRAARH